VVSTLLCNEVEDNAQFTNLFLFLSIFYQLLDFRKLSKKTNRQQYLAVAKKKFSKMETISVQEYDNLQNVARYISVVFFFFSLQNFSLYYT
jgi:hypothetical protein